MSYLSSAKNERTAAEAPSASDFDEKMSRRVMCWQACSKPAGAGPSQPFLIRFWHGSPCGTPEAEEEQDLTSPQRPPALVREFGCLW